MDSNPPTPKNVPPPLQQLTPDHHHQHHKDSSSCCSCSPSSPKPRAPSPGSSSTAAAAAPQHASRRHATFRGIRSRSGKWVSEIREPRKTTRIWLGTYPTPDMAAAAYDVAALALKGPDTNLNFPNSILSYPIPASLSAADIRAAAAAAAEARRADRGEGPGSGKTTSSSTATASENVVLERRSEEFIDEDELLNMPNLLDDMARGMQMNWIDAAAD
ncbi:ethylene-responsive transcription factor ERF027 [Senna tora]|uniref:Ethylene-responsive transcription factor ERF027 n=1 Tax=Senna tora TaxID=362788 RepID=A0A834T234_9FABA|nr:ethylene-responsive transcription factor ERF027 [Senna tora]